MVIILVPDSAFAVQQGAPYAMFLPLVICLLNRQQEIMGKLITITALKKSINVGIIALITIILWGSVWQTIIDQEAMRQGTIVAKTMAENILDKLDDYDLLDENREYAIIGSPLDNPLANVNAIYYQANDYAQVASNYWDNYLANWTWKGIFKNICGVYINMCDDGVYENFLASQEVTEMQAFPKEGFIKEIDGVTVIKVAE